jgi:hypothetical protein
LATAYYDIIVNAMKVTFTRTHSRGYSVSIDGDGIDEAVMDPAPGFDERLPHDAAHFIVENELGIMGGVFGQLAAGGTANTFHSATAKHPKRRKKRGSTMAKENSKDLLFSEHAVYAARSRWEHHEVIPETRITPDQFDRICNEFEAFALEWQALEPGGSVTLKWRHDPQRKHPKKV